MNDSFVTFLEQSAVFMSTDRPDIWTKESALNDLRRWVAEAIDSSEQFTGTGGFILTKYCDEDGGVEYELQRTVLSHYYHPEDPDDAFVFNYAKNGRVVGVVPLDVEG